MELEAKYGQRACKCVHYRENFPDCACERESVSNHSPGLVEDSEILVRTLFRRSLIGQDGRLKPSYFRMDPPSRGFSVDRIQKTDEESLIKNKKTDDRYDGDLFFIGSHCGDVRALTAEDRERLFCVYDSATEENHAHADICQNFVVSPSTPNRKSLMMEIAWQLREVFGEPIAQPLDFTASNV